MRLTPKVCQAIATAITFLTAVGATAPSPTASIVWGPISSGLQCSLTMMPPDPGGAYYLLLAFKNVGSGNITLTDGALRSAQTGLVNVGQGGTKSRPWSSMSGSDPSALIVVKPDQTIATRFAADKTVAGQSVTFDGSLKPVGASASIALRCGPLILNPPKT
jgi:hypothetical protein